MNQHMNYIHKVLNENVRHTISMCEFEYIY